MSFDEILDLTAEVFLFDNKCYRKAVHGCSYTRERIMSSVSYLQQYPVGDSYNINNGMRAADGSGDTLGLQEKALSRRMRYLVNNITK